MKQISNYAETLIESIVLGAWERGAYADTVLGYDEEEEWDYQKKEVELLMTYIADLEAEVEVLRLRKNQEAQISEMRRVGNLMADHLNAMGISRHDREWADASNPIPDESVKMKAEVDAPQARAERAEACVERLEAMVERFIEFGTPLADIARAVNYGNEIELLAEHINNWDKLVAEWKERAK